MYDEHQGSFLENDGYPRVLQEGTTNIGMANVDVINAEDMMDRVGDLENSHISVHEEVHANDSGNLPRDCLEEGVNVNSLETMDDNPDDMQSLMKIATSQGGNEDIKIKVKDYQLEDDSVEAGEKFYESDDEEKNYTKTNLKNNSREEQLKLIPSL